MSNKYIPGGDKDSELLESPHWHKLYFDTMLTCGQMAVLMVRVVIDNTTHPFISNKEYVTLRVVSAFMKPFMTENQESPRIVSSSGNINVLCNLSVRL